MRSYSPLQVALMYKALLRDDKRKLAEQLVIMRSAQHAKDIQKLYDDLVRQSQPEEDRTRSAENFMNKLIGAFGRR